MPKIKSSQQMPVVKVTPLMRSQVRREKATLIQASRPEGMNYTNALSENNQNHY
jgi:hypothetical protein